MFYEQMISVLNEKFRLNEHTKLVDMMFMWQCILIQ